MQNSSLWVSANNGNDKEIEDYHRAFLLERHRREELERNQREACDDSARKVASYHNVLSRIDDASKSLMMLAKLASDNETLQCRVDQLVTALSVVAPIAMQGASSVTEKIVILKACEGLELEMWSNLSITGVEGLPRLRVFSDEPCFVCLVLLHNDLPLWTSGLLHVSQCSSGNSSWTADNESRLLIPIEIFRKDVPVRLGIQFEGSIVAEALPVSCQQVESITSMQLFHNGIPLPEGWIRFTLLNTRSQSSSSGSGMERAFSMRDG